MSEGVSRDQEELPERILAPQGGETGLRVVSLVPRISSSGCDVGPEGLRKGDVGEGRRVAASYLLGPRQLLPSLHLPPPLSSDRPSHEPHCWGGEGRGS